MASQKTGTSGWLIIDDDGYTVTFRIQNTQSATWANGKSWSGVVNGVGVGGTFSINGVQTVTLGSWGVGYTQTVSLTMGATGTSGLGGPSTFSIGIYRATVPGTPGTPVASEITPTSMRLSWTIPGNGGSAIDQMLLRRSPAADLNTYTDYALPGNATTYVATDLSPSTRYYWRVYAHNGVGYSAQSGVISEMTGSGAYASINGVWVPVPILYDPDGSTWIYPEILSSNGTAPWNPAI